MVDLHTHSTESDGRYSPVELIQLAKAEGINLIALTDHDTINGISNAQKEAGQVGIQFVPGIEIEIQHPSNEFHLLGLGIYKQLDIFSRDLCELKNNREKRNIKILEKINNAGINLSFEELRTHAKGDTIARPHFARALVEKGIVSSIDEAFRHYLGVGKAFYVERETLSLEKSISLIKNAGGIAVIAHPVSLSLPIRKLKEFLLKCKHKGLDGIEVYHPYHSSRLMQELQIFANHNKFITTGGSDFHGKDREKRKLGHIAENVPIPGMAGDFFQNKRPPV